MKRAVIQVSMELIHHLLDLPEDVEVLHVSPGHHGMTMAVVVTTPNLVDIDPGACPPELNPTYELVDGRARLKSLT